MIQVNISVTSIHLHRKPKLSFMDTRLLYSSLFTKVRIEHNLHYSFIHINSKMAQIRQILLIFLTSLLLGSTLTTLRVTRPSRLFGVRRLPCCQTFRKLGLESSYGIQQRVLWRGVCSVVSLVCSLESCPQQRVGRRVKQGLCSALVMDIGNDSGGLSWTSMGIPVSLQKAK